nr:ABC transporter B family member 28 isoform X1 [Ipomoea batatas]
MAAAAAAAASFTLPFRPFTPPKHRRQPPLLAAHLNHYSRFRVLSLASPRVLARCQKPKRLVISSAYAGPAIDAFVSENELKFEDSGDNFVAQPIEVINWGLLWKLLSDHKLQLAASVLTLVGCTTCTLTMPLLSGRFFEVLIGARPEPLWKVLGRVAVMYSLEPIFTVIFVVNMNAMWEKVMSSLRAQIFQRVLIQKVEFFDRYKVGELTALLTSDLGSLKNIVSENVSRDRGFRALSEASYYSKQK